MINSLTVRKPTEITTDGDITKLVDRWHAALDKSVEAGDISATTATTYKRGAARFMAWCDLAQVQDVDADTLQDWKASMISQGYKANSINAWMAGIRAFFTWATSQRMLITNPAIGVKGANRKGTSKKHRRQALTNLEVRRLLSQPDTNTAEGKRDLAWLSLMLYTAIRTVEVHRAMLADLHTSGNLLVLDVTGKGHTEADDVVVIDNPKAAEALSCWLAVRGDKPGALFWSLSDRSRGQALSLQAIRGLWMRYKRSAGIVGNKSLHSLRHTAVTSSIIHGASPIQAQNMARHKSLDTTMVYFHEIDRLTNPAESFINYDD